jgi:hypothetical protein
MEETMKRTLTTAGVILMLALATALGAQGHHNGGGNHNQTPPSYNHENNDDYQNDIREFRGFLIVNESDIRHNAGLGFHINMNPMQITHIEFMAGTPRRTGFGIIIQKPGGGHAYYRLDRKGSRIAERIFARNRHNSRNIFVEVTGWLNRHDRSLNVMSMERIRNNRNGNPGWDDDGHDRRG